MKNKYKCVFKVWINQGAYVELSNKKYTILVPSPHHDYLIEVARKKLAQKFFNGEEERVYGFECIKKEKVS